MKRQIKPWELVGGGTSFGYSKYPCDIHYYNKKSHKHFTVDCTWEAYRRMPDKVRVPSDITRRAGVNRKSLMHFDEEF